MPRKHIMHITFNMGIGGTEQVIRQLIEGVDTKELQTSVLCIDGSIGPWGKLLQQQGITFYTHHRTSGLDLNLIRYIHKLIKTEDIDIVHCHQYTPYTYGLLGSLLTKAAVIFTEHGRFYPDTSSIKRRLLNPAMALKTAFITAISAATSQALVEYENFNSQQIQVIYNGIADIAEQAQLEVGKQLKAKYHFDGDSIILGTVARLDPIKNHQMMLEAFSFAHQQCSKLKLLIVGDGAEMKSLQALAKRLQINEHVIFTGFIPSPKDHLAIMDVFLLPSLSEGTSMTLLEAMCLGKASIATSVGGTPEIIEHGISGILIANNDVQELTQAIMTLTDNEKRVTIGKQARLRYEERFTLNKMIQDYSRLYKQINV